MTVKLIRYDAACRAVAAAKCVDEAKKIRDQSIAIRAYAKQAKNKELEADALEIRMRATRRIDQLRVLQKDTIGLNKGAAIPTRVDKKPTLASQGIDKNLAHQARTLGQMTERQFDGAIADARDAITRVVKTVVRSADILQKREQDYGRRIEKGCTVADLSSLISQGNKYSVIYADPPWEYNTYSGRGKQRSAERHYDTMTTAAIEKLPIKKLAHDSCALFLWATFPKLDQALSLVEKWGFEYKTAGLIWIKQNKNGKGIFTGMGHWTRANAEPCLFATRGNPRRLHADVHQIIMAPVGRHSEKPEEARKRIERLFGAPSPNTHIELFAREDVLGWTVWGNEIAPLKEAAE